MIVDSSKRPEGLSDALNHALDLKEELARYCFDHNISVLVSMQEASTGDDVLINTYIGYLDVVAAGTMVDHVCERTADWAMRMVKLVEERVTGHTDLTLEEVDLIRRQQPGNN